MTETTATYTIDPPALRPADLAHRVDELEAKIQAILAGQDTQGELLETLRDEQLLHVKALDSQENRLAHLVSRELRGMSETPHCHMRIQIAKCTTGYAYETSVSVDDDDAETVQLNVRQLLIDADAIARREIERRELLDGVAS